MDLKKMKIALIVAVIATMYLAGNAMAAATWVSCTPKKIGPYGAAGVQLQVINCANNVDPSAGKSGWLTLNTIGTDQQMAAILTAMSLGKPVSVKWDPNVKTGAGYVIADSVLFIN